MANEFGSKGVLIQVEDTPAAGTFTTIGGISGATGFGGGSTTDIDVTALEDVARRFIKGFTDYGEVSLPLNIQAGNTMQQRLVDDAQSVASVDRNYRVVKSDGTTVFIAFEGYSKDFSLDLSSDSAVTGTAVLKMNGAPTITI